MARINATWPARLASENLMGSSAMAALANDQLLNRVLQCLAVTDIGIERLLTNVRFLMLRNAVNGTADENLLGFYCSVAAQCFINEYVFSTTKAEAEEARRLRASLEETLTAGDACPALWVAVVGAYFPLHALANAETSAWPVLARMHRGFDRPADSGTGGGTPDRDDDAEPDRNRRWSLTCGTAAI